MIHSHAFINILLSKIDHIVECAEIIENWTKKLANLFIVSLNFQIKLSNGLMLRIHYI